MGQSNDAKANVAATNELGPIEPLGPIRQRVEPSNHADATMNWGNINTAIPVPVQIAIQRREVPNAATPTTQPANTASRALAEATPSEWTRRRVIAALVADATTCLQR
jgi:hypothetical protein